jgi:holo-[acyl-carrier protein] synthase
MWLLASVVGLVEQMIVGTGVDLAGIDRTMLAIDGPRGDRFRERVFCPAEVAYCESRGRGRGSSYAARFAAKEAVMKALGVGWGKDAGWQDIEVCRQETGRPDVQLRGAAAATAQRRGITTIHLSLSHTEGSAVAFAVAEALPKTV